MKQGCLPGFKNIFVSGFGGYCMQELSPLHRHNTIPGSMSLWYNPWNWEGSWTEGTWHFKFTFFHGLCWMNQYLFSWSFISRSYYTSVGLLMSISVCNRQPHKHCILIGPSFYYKYQCNIVLNLQNRDWGYSGGLLGFYCELAKKGSWVGVSG